MKSRALVCAIAAAALGASSFAFAQDRDHDRGDRGQGRRGEYSQRDQAPRPAVAQRHNDSRRGDYRSSSERLADWHAGEREQVMRHNGWVRGGYVQPQYRGHQYVVNDWRARQLYAPPYGYQWVQADDSGEYALVALATGLIAQLLLNQ
ncbi:MAG: RcnB family protein [Burkholderiales bacterium]|nr:RcnB family protein [Burkholderiales bacterium]